MPQPSASGEDHSTSSGFSIEWKSFGLLYLIVALSYINALSDPALRESWRWTFITILILVQLCVYLTIPHITRFRHWVPIFLTVQAALTFGIGILTQGHRLSIVLYLGLIVMSMSILWPRRKQAVLAGALVFGLLALNLNLSQGFQGFFNSLEDVLPWLAVLLTFVVLLLQMTEARRRDQMFLRKQEEAHRQLQAYADQIEELTISKERERMARELHDTLAQGVAGLILQLEAIDSHLESGNPTRAQAGVHQAMERARRTLREARAAIRALRSPALERGDLTDVLSREVERFAVTGSANPTFETQTGSLEVPAEVASEVLRVLQESLTNVAHHAQASYVLVKLERNENGFKVSVQDDGVGFDVQKGLERPGCYGLTGMRERAERLGGVLHIESTPGVGTTVILLVEETADQDQSAQNEWQASHARPSLDQKVSP